MSVEWSRAFSTGVEWQDNHHKELLKKIDNLLDAMNVGMGRDEVMRLFKFMDDYFVFHFEAEENAMERLRYPDVDAHVNEHRGFIKEITRLEDECRESVSVATVVKTQSMVVDWLIKHIGKSDKALGAFIVEKRT